MRVQEASEKVITVHEAWEMKGRTREYKVWTISPCGLQLAGPADIGC